MTFRPKIKDAATIEMYRVALANAESNPGIAKDLSDIGYTAEVLEQGKKLLAETRKMFETAISKKGFRKAAYAEFMKKKKELARIYNNHRSKGKLVFRDDPGKLELLALSTPIANLYIPWMESVKKFYKEVSEIENLQNELSRLAVTTEQINESLALIKEVEDRRAVYINLKGESQDATSAKEKSLARMRDWMKEFYGVAKLGLETQPQLLESLGKIVKS